MQAAAPPEPTLNPITSPIDLTSAFRLAGVQNPEILIARERVVEAVALHQLAAAQLLPNLNAGTNYDAHIGPLQQSTGNILKVNRSSLYVGMGANAVGAGTVNIPGLVWNGNLSDNIFAVLISKQVIQGRGYSSDAIRNDVLLRVGVAYVELLRAVGHRAVAVQTRGESAELARITAAYARAGQGRQADADRAATDLEQRNAEIIEAESQIATASARLAQVLDLDPSVRLEPIDGWVVPAPVVPDPIPLPELMAIALHQRPELLERQTTIREAVLALKAAKLLPLSPNYTVGYSAGSFGGGTNLASEGIAQANGTVLRQPRFDNFADREDLDVVVYWTLRNLGVGNLALVRIARSHLHTEELRAIEMLDRVGAEVAQAYARTRTRFVQIDLGERALRASSEAFREDLNRIRGREGLPIEVLNSLRLLGSSRLAYLDAISDYNRAQFELYVALGQPPACSLARPVPVNLMPPPAPAACPAPCGPE
jgi:outer membrane protein TolC